MQTQKHNYGNAILAAFEYLLKNYPEVFVIGQGLWSPWYVGNSMTNLDKKFGKQRVIDTPVSESATTGAAVGASLAGMRPIVVHPRMDFMIYAMDSIVNQAAKWSSMFGGQANPSLTIRSIINRGGEQGAQHSQALHAWFAHVPGLRVVMPSSVADARDLLIASVLLLHTYVMVSLLPWSSWPPLVFCFSVCLLFALQDTTFNNHGPQTPPSQIRPQGTQEQAPL